jgi:hypothetical protein
LKAQQENCHQKIYRFFDTKPARFHDKQAAELGVHNQNPSRTAAAHKQSPMFAPIVRRGCVCSASLAACCTLPSRTSRTSLSALPVRAASSSSSCASPAWWSCSTSRLSTLSSSSLCSGVPGQPLSTSAPGRDATTTEKNKDAAPEVAESRERFNHVAASEGAPAEISFIEKVKRFGAQTLIGVFTNKV